MAGPTVVAVLNSNDDTVELLRMSLENAGFMVVSAHIDQIRRGQTSLAESIAEHDPRVVVYDISPPYDRNWLFLDHLKRHPSMRGRRFVLTSTNPQRVHEIAKVDDQIIEVIGKPYDLTQIVEAVRANSS